MVINIYRRGNGIFNALCFCGCNAGALGLVLSGTRQMCGHTQALLRILGIRTCFLGNRGNICHFKDTLVKCLHTHVCVCISSTRRLHGLKTRKMKSLPQGDMDHNVQKSYYFAYCGRICYFSSKLHY